MLRNRAKLAYSGVGPYLEGTGTLDAPPDIQAQLQLQNEAAHALRLMVSGSAAHMDAVSAKACAFLERRTHADTSTVLRLRSRRYAQARRFVLPEALASRSAVIFSPRSRKAVYAWSKRTRSRAFHCTGAGSRRG